MNRWETAFKESNFAKNWAVLKKTVSQKKDFKPSQPNIIAEYSKFLKVYTFIDEIITHLDKDLVYLPEFDSNNLHTQLNNSRSHLSTFYGNPDLNSIRNANTHLEIVAAFLYKFHHYSANSSRAITRYFNENRRLVEDYLVKFDDQSNDKLEALSKILTEANDSDQLLKSVVQRIEALDAKLFDSEGTEDRIDDLEQKISSIHKSASQKVAEIDSADDQATNLLNRIKNSLEDAETNLNEIKDDRVEFDDKLREIKAFHTLAFGEKDEDGEVVSQGIKAELNSYRELLNKEVNLRKEQLDKEKSEFHTYVQATKKEIQELLGHATTASLSAAYRRERKSYSKQISLYTKMFYGSLGALFLAGVIASIMGYFGGWTTEKALTILLINSPMVAAAIWLTTFSSKRRAEAYKLQQEYSHKVAVTSSYQGFKKQIELLGEDSPLLHDLLETAIKVIDKNPSGSYKKVKADNHPIVDIGNKAIDTAKQAFTKKDKAPEK